MMDISRFDAAWWGGFIGDALAMPAHWYYTRERIGEDYGDITTYLPPHNPHPDSFLWRSEYACTGTTDDILHEQVRWWNGPRDIHYHQFLHAGENTLNVRLAMLLAESLLACDRYDRDDFAHRYTDFMLTPGMHGDTYVEEYHRAFFRNYGKGLEVDDCGIVDIHIGGLATLAPLILFHADDREALQAAVTEHVDLTHKGEEMAAAATLYADLAFLLLHGASMDEAFAQARPATHPALGFPYRDWAANRADNEVIGQQFSPACYLKDALPATLHLALKYAQSAREGLLANVRAGGDNCHRGVVLGTLLGAANGNAVWPQTWVSGLHEYDALHRLLGALRARAG